MSFLQFIRPQVLDAVAGIGQQQQIAQNVLETIRGFVPKVQSAWIGGDANEFAADVGRKLVPAMTELIAAIGGINLNLNKASDIVDSADGKALEKVNGLADLFSKI